MTSLLAFVCPAGKQRRAKEKYNSSEESVKPYLKNFGGEGVFFQINI